MRNTLFIFLAFIAVLFTSCTRNEVVITEAELPDDIFYLQNDLKPYSGRCLIYFTGTENIKEEMSYKKGYLNGERISYYKNGQIKLQGEYSMGKYDGTWKKYAEDGKMIFIATYQNDSLLHFESQAENNGEEPMLPQLIPSNRSKVVASVIF